MSLNEINLSPYLLTQLYPASLVKTENSAPVTESDDIVSPPSSQQIAWKCLGNNQKKILAAVQYPNATHLPDAQLDFLTQLLTACKLSLHDIALINLNNFPGVSYEDILQHFQPGAILLYGISAQQFGFPFETPQYQVQSFTHYTVMHAPSLEDLQNDKPAKQKLWNSLKQLFNL